MNEEIVVKFGGDTAPLAAAMRSITHKGKEFAAEFAKAIYGPMVAALGASEVLNKIKEWQTWAIELKKTASTMGTTMEFAQGLGKAIHKLGIEPEAATRAFSKLSQTIGEARSGSSTAQKTFEKWGININGKTNEEIFYAIADSLSQISDPAIRAAMRFELLGKTGKEMAIAMDNGSEAIKRLVEHASKLSDGEVARLANMGRAYQSFFGRIETGWKRIFALTFGGVPKDLEKGITEEAVKKRAFQRFNQRKTDSATDYDAAFEELLHETMGQAAPGGGVERDEKKHESTLEKRGEKRRKQAKETLDLIQKAEEMRRKNALDIMSDDDKVKALVRERLALQRKFEESSGSIKDKASVQLEIEKKQKEILDAKEVVHKKTEETARKILETKEKTHRKEQESILASLRLKDQQDQLGRAEGDRLRFTVGELAELGRSRGGFFSTRGGWRSNATRNEQIAMQIQDLENQARQAYDFGNDSKGRALQSRAENLRRGVGALSSSEKNPYENIETSLTKMNETLDVRGIVVREIADE